MTVCPHCQQDNVEGALICENCGMLLVAPRDGSLTTRRMEAEETATGAELAATLRGTQTFHPGAQLYVRLLSWSPPQLFALEVEDEIVLGRVDNYTDFPPDIDLSHFGGWEQGVSRLHASIRREGSRLMVSDLGSTNGTFLNEERLPARQPHLLCDGDRIRLGLLELQIFFHEPGPEEEVN